MATRPATFDLATRAAQVVVLNDFSLQVFIADEQGTVRASTRATIVGTNISQRDYFRHEASLPADDGKMYIGGLTQGQVTRQWQLNLARRLDNGNGTFAGIIAASTIPMPFRGSTSMKRGLDAGRSVWSA